MFQYFKNLVFSKTEVTFGEIILLVIPSLLGVMIMEYKNSTDVSIMLLSGLQAVGCVSVMFQSYIVIKLFIGWVRKF